MSITPIPSQRPWVRLVVHALLIGFAVIFAFPFYWVATSAIKPLAEVMSLPATWWPSEWQWHNYWDALTFTEDTSPYYRNWDAFFAAVTGNGEGDGTATQQALGAWKFFFSAFFVRCVGNTLFVAVAGVIGAVISNALAAYGFSRIDWPGRGLFLLDLGDHDGAFSGHHGSSLHHLRQTRVGGNTSPVVGSVLVWKRVQYLSAPAVFSNHPQ